ncbi:MULTISPECIES: hypothetical protein [unclassified Xanthomonas]|uniref:hypothetical protein n=1 Tax=unclassified Xanthomonas TaxID=2643310 RepID=UPI00161448B1|nr:MULTISPECIES: hypothetical protein [unclassified Xanthomonas]MBB5878532.1 hypothetical protein [Xanthomonas sp. 3498]MBB5943879.1 hypothetical protein [Xanthomonas sp. 3307]
MNWKAILAYTALLFLIQCGTGIASGFFDPLGWINAWNLLSFLLCAALFAHMTRRVAQHRLAHACLILAMYAVFADVVAALLPPDMTDEPAMFFALEWLQLLASTGLGLLVGWVFRHAADQHRML